MRRALGLSVFGDLTAVQCDPRTRMAGLFDRGKGLSKQGRARGGGLLLGQSARRRQARDFRVAFAKIDQGLCRAQGQVALADGAADDAEIRTERIGKGLRARLNCLPPEMPRPQARVLGIEQGQIAQERGLSRRSLGRKRAKRIGGRCDRRRDL